MVAQCYDLETLRRYLAGKMDSDDQMEVESHLLSCASCQALAAQQEPSGDSLLNALQFSAKKPPPPGSHLAAALKAIVALEPAATIASGAPENGDTGRLIRDYELQRKLGEGGMGAVYLATHTRLKKHVAVKLLKADRMSDSSAIARFSAEMEAVGKLEHPHIVRALDAGEEDGVHFLVMEYLAGIDLNRIVRGLGQLSVADASELIRQAAIGLQHAHENEVIHRDVKPSNLMLLPTGKVKVLDLGLAHFRPSLPALQDLTRDHHVLGTMLYIAPEQLIAGQKVDARSDVFSLGIALYELLLGRLPTRDGLLVQVTPEELASRPDVPPEIWQLAAQMTSMDPNQRPASMSTVAETLRPWTLGANLPALLQRVAGYTSVVGQPPLRLPSSVIGPSMQLVAAGIPTGASGGNVVPPPLPPQRVISPPPPPFSPRNSALWGVAASLSMVAVLLTALLVRTFQEPNDAQGKPDPPPPFEVPPIPMGTVVVASETSTYQKLIQGILKNGQVYAVDESGSEFDLRTGENSLPPGKYTLKHKNGDLQLVSESFRVLDGDTTKIDPELDFVFPWLYPQIPDLVGAYSKYSGTLWHLGLGSPRHVKERSFDLVLTTGEEQDHEGIKCRWLKIEIDDQLNGIKETAWLLIDTQAWKNRQQLTVKKGFLQLESGEIREVLERTLGENPPTALVAPFDLAKDTLAEVAIQFAVSLPPRVNVHQVLVLLFDADSEAVHEIIRQVRPKLPTQREFELVTATTPLGTRTGLGMLARAPKEGIATEDTVVRLERNESLPFSYTKLEVESFYFKGNVKLDSCNRPGEELAAEKVPDFESILPRMTPPAPKTNAFDVATLPEDGVGAILTGAISMANRKLLYSAEVRMLGSMMVDDAPHRWLEIRVESGATRLDYKESATLLIDESAYQSGEFVVKRGWFKNAHGCFPFDRSGDMEATELALRQLGKPLPAERVGVHDVASLLFGGSFAASQFSGLRAQLAHEIIAGDRKRTHENITIELRESRRRVLAQASELKPADAGMSSSYRIVRSSDVPFEFIEVRLKMAHGVVLTTELQKRLHFPPLGAVAEKEFAEEAEATVKLAAEAAEKHPNWRMWNLKKWEKVWAEYGGQAEGTILLRDEADRLYRITHEDLLDEADRAAVARGRTWQGPDGKPLFRGELRSSDEPGVRYRFQLFSNPNATQTRRLNEFSTVDRRLMEELEEYFPKKPVKPPKRSR